MDSYPRLYADTSLRTPFILSEDGIDSGWEELLIRHSDRFMVGSDTYQNSQWDDYGSIMKGSRSWLALLPRSVAEKIANGNASALLGRQISDQTIPNR
jgi:predicted TIM-barrel fold metal-dependent hydrolase